MFCLFFVQNQRFVGVEGKVFVEFQKEKWRNTSQPTDISSSSAPRGASWNYSSLSLSLSSPSLSLAPPPALCRAAPPHCPAPFPSPRVGGAPLHEGNSPSLRSAPSKTSLPSLPTLRFKIVNINNVTGCFLFLKELSGTGKTV